MSCYSNHYSQESHLSSLLYTSLPGCHDILIAIALFSCIWVFILVLFFKLFFSNSVIYIYSHILNIRSPPKLNLYTCSIICLSLASSDLIGCFPTSAIMFVFSIEICYFVQLVKGPFHQLMSEYKVLIKFLPQRRDRWIDIHNLTGKETQINV